MRLALLFSGQGGQRPEHGQQIGAEASAELRQALADAAIDIATVNPEKLAKNSIAQPFIFAQQMTLWSRLQADLPRPICAAGYSLGEMAACSAAGAFSAVEGLQLCVERARLMDQVAPDDSGMLAVLGLDESLVARIAAESGLAIAIHNAPRHYVIAGQRAGIDAAAPRLEAAGAARLVHLAVHTPSHTALLAAAAVNFEKRLNLLPDCRLAFTVLSAIDATPARSGRAALNALARQICTRLDWANCLQTVLEMQPDVVLEIGPGNALARLFAELAPNVPVRACDDFRSNDGIVSWVRSHS
jgi:[acyl-carrier-protein] S-malonyltransferase